MCDYSLHQVASRPAEIGDELVTTSFSATMTRGFSAVGEPNVAVCLLPGTEIAFEKEAERGHPLASLFPRLRFGKLGANVARVRYINVGMSSMHHDALEFANGTVVLLTHLSPGQRACVLQLPSQANAAKDVEEPRRSVLAS
jgi:hypothetical protein